MNLDLDQFPSRWECAFGCDGVQFVVPPMSLAGLRDGLAIAPAIKGLTDTEAHARLIAFLRAIIPAQAEVMGCLSLPQCAMAIHFVVSYAAEFFKGSSLAKNFLRISEIVRSEMRPEARPRSSGESTPG